MSRDRLYADPLGQIGSFAFDEDVVEVFADMISRSVPGYASILKMTGELAARFAQESSALYDLGCSLGTGARLMQTQVLPSCTIYAIDSSEAMIQAAKQARVETGAESKSAKLVFEHCDARERRISHASFVALNFTLQFLPVEERSALVHKIFDGLLPGGALVLSEKIHFSDPHQDQLMIDLHHNFKRANGYSDLEIAQKRTALENTLVTETLADHETRLRGIGFSVISVWFQCFNFVSLLAIK